MLSGLQGKETPVYFTALKLPFVLFPMLYNSKFDPYIDFFLFFTVYLSGGSGQIVGVKHVDVIPGSQQKSASLLIQQQRVRVEAIGGTQKQGYTASLQQLCHTEIKRLLNLCVHKVYI